MSRAYLLLDRAQIESLPDRLFEMADGVAVHSLYQRTIYSALECVGPMLVGVAPDSPLASIFWQEWSASAGIWLETEADEGQLLEHLRSLIHVRTESLTTVLFRFYDPRITALWLADLPSHERDRLMGPVRLIRLPGVAIRQQTEHPGASYARQPWLLLTDTQLAHLNGAKRQGFVRQLLAHCQQYFPEALNGLDPAARQQWAINCQESAARNGFSAVDEVLLWARFHAVLGSDFPDGLTHAIYRQRLAERDGSPRQRLDQLNIALTHQLLTAKDCL